MAGPIRIAVLADSSAASQSMRQFADSVDGSVRQASDSISRGSRDMRDGTERAIEGFDRGEQRAMGFRDSITGLQDTAGGFSKLAKGDLAGGLLTLGMGVGDLASGFANFLIPAFSKAIGWIKNLTIVQRILNITMLTNPVFLVVAAIVALVAIFVIAYKKSETFRNIVNSLWATIKSVFTRIGPVVWSAVQLYIRYITFLPRKIIELFSGAGSWLAGAGRRIIDGLIGGIRAGFQRVKDTLSRLTGMLPDWKGPASTDKRILHESGRMVLSGFQEGLEDRYAGVQASLGRFTAGLGGAVEVAPSGTGSATGGRQVVFEIKAPPSGTLDRLFLQWFRETARANGIAVRG